MSLRVRLESFIRTALMDRLLAVIAVTPQMYVLHNIAEHILLRTAIVYEYAIGANIVMVISGMLTRRLARRVSLNPLFWIVTAGRSYWAFLVVHYAYRIVETTRLVHTISLVLFFISMSIMIAARFNLGRNVGFVPARRNLVTTGLYGIVRHPIHSGELFFFVSYMFRSPTLLNIVLMTIGIVFVVWKSLIEERFLSEDEDYRAYCKDVPYRWIPGVL